MCSDPSPGQEGTSSQEGRGCAISRGTQGEEEKEPGGEGSIGRPQGGDQRVGENRGPHGEFPTRLPARLIRQDAVRNDQVQLCVWGEEGSLTIFWERLSYLCRASPPETWLNYLTEMWQN